MSHPRHIVAVVAAVLLTTASPAFAGTVSVSDGTLHYTPSVAADHLLLDAHDGAATLIDQSFSLVAGPGCTGNGFGAQCANVTSAIITLGPGGSVLDVRGSAKPPVQVLGGTGDDTVWSAGGALAFEGANGNDQLLIRSTSPTHPDWFAGGPGRDAVSYANRTTPQQISLDNVPNDGSPGEGDNIASDVEVVVGGDANDTIVGGSGNDELNGSNGEDTIAGLDGDDLLDGGADSTCGTEGLDGGAGADTLIMRGGTYALGGAGNDSFAASTEACAGPNTASGGPGTDTADFSDITDAGIWVSLDGVADDGVLGLDNYGTDIEDLSGGPGGMALVGNDSSNVLVGGAGDDLLDGGGGTDHLFGGDGVDVADYSQHVAPVSLTLDGQANDGATGEGDTISGDIENLVGGEADDLLAGDFGENVLDGGPGADVMSGGDGIDAVDYSSRTGPVTADLDGQASDDGQGSEGDTIGANVEALFGGSADDTLTGNSADGLLVGQGGNDRLSDRGGEDLLDGGAGNDGIESDDAAADLVSCGAGFDEARRDALDELEADCERVVLVTPTSPKPPPTPAPPAPPPTPPVTPIDRVPPRAALTVDNRPSSRRMRSVGLLARITCDEPCAVVAELRAFGATARSLKRRGVRATGVLARGAAPEPAAGTRRVRLTLNATGKRALRRLPAGTYVLRVRARDRGGNLRRLSRVLRVS